MCLFFHLTRHYGHVTLVSCISWTHLPHGPPQIPKSLPQEIPYSHSSQNQCSCILFINILNNTISSIYMFTTELTGSTCVHFPLVSLPHQTSHHIVPTGNLLLPEFIDSVLLLGLQLYLISFIINNCLINYLIPVFF